MKSLVIILLSIFLFSCSGNKSNLNTEINIIPKPLVVHTMNKEFKLTENLKIHYQNPELESIAGYLQKHIAKISGIDLDFTEKEVKKGIILSLDASDTLETEGYWLTVNPKFIKISAHKPNGVFYGVQSLLQLIFYNKSDDGTCKIPCVEIEDKPKFQWRGMHLDVCRHFFSKEFVKKYIDLLAYHKMNVFHWHLTEDQGWRIEIKKYPKLMQISSKRKETVVKKNWGTYDGTPHQGFYTQDDIKEVVAYAKERFITVVPEIEMPGHSLAALAAYPELGCTGKEYEVATTWGVFDDVYCAGNEKTFEFLQDVLLEVIDLFPGEYIHIGGDECPKKEWKKCPKCQARIKNEGLKDEHELQSYFIHRIEKFLNEKGKRIIGWDEILEGGLAPNAAVMSWRGVSGGIEAAKMKHNVVMTPGSHCYFDHYQGDTATEPFAIGGYTTLEKVYAYNPIPEELSPEESKYILGCQANLWTEYIADEKHAEYMALPRMCALAEVAWLPLHKKDEADFLLRMEKHYNFLDFFGYNYRAALKRDESK